VKWFKGLLDNLKPLHIPATDSNSTYGSGLFGGLIYPVAAALDPEFRLAWLDDWQDVSDDAVKSTVTGMCVVVISKYIVFFVVEKLITG